MFKYIEVKELGTFCVLDADGLEQDMVTLQTANGHVFSVLASYLVNEVSAIISPYDNCECVFENGDFFQTNDGDSVSPSEVEYVFSE